VTAERHHLWELLDRMQMDLRDLQGKLVSVRSIVAGMNLVEPERTLCPKCGDVGLKGPQTLAEHLYNSHDGPVPDHYLAIDALVTPDDDAMLHTPKSQAS